MSNNNLNDKILDDAAKELAAEFIAHTNTEIFEELFEKINGAKPSREQIEKIKTKSLTYAREHFNNIKKNNERF